MEERRIGTLIRCADVTEERLRFYRRAGIGALQIAGAYEPWLGPEKSAADASDSMFALFGRHGLEVPSMFLSFPNQDWSHPETGVGLVPESARTERMILSCRQMNWGKKYGIRDVVCHVGFIPEKEDAFSARLISDLKQLVRFAASNGQNFLFETGTETVAGLGRTLERIGEPNAGINLDPANLLFYDRDDPSVLLDRLFKYVKAVHCKDAVRPASGEKHGHETVLGKGGTHFADILRRMIRCGFKGELIIERELPLGPEQEKDVAEAVKYINSIIEGA